MTDTPITRAARRMALIESGTDCFDQLDEGEQERLREVVRGVLESVRQPTTPMFRAADDAYANRADKTGNVVLFNEDYTTIYTAMIDAALEDG